MFHASEDYDGPGRIPVGFLPLAMLDRARQAEVRAELVKEAYPHPPVLVGEMPHRMRLVMWLRDGLRFDVRELKAPATANVVGAVSPGLTANAA